MKNIPEICVTIGQHRFHVCLSFFYSCENNSVPQSLRNSILRNECGDTPSLGMTIVLKDVLSTMSYKKYYFKAVSSERLNEKITA